MDQHKCHPSQTVRMTILYWTLPSSATSVGFAAAELLRRREVIDPEEVGAHSSERPRIELCTANSRICRHGLRESGCRNRNCWRLPSSCNRASLRSQQQGLVRSLPVTLAQGAGSPCPPTESSVRFLADHVRSLVASVRQPTPGSRGRVLMTSSQPTCNGALLRVGRANARYSPIGLSPRDDRRGLPRT